MLQSIVRHIVVVQKIAFEGFHVSLRTAFLEADLIVHAGIVDKSIEAAKPAVSLIDHSPTLVRIAQLRFDTKRVLVLPLEFLLDVLKRPLIAIDDDGNRALVDSSACDRRADPFGTAGDDDDLVS